MSNQLSGEISNLAGQLHTLIDAVNTAITDLTELQADVVALTASLAAEGQDVTDVQALETSVNGTITDLQNTLASVGTPPAPPAS